MSLENAGHLSPVSSALGLGGAFQKGLVFLLKLAWNSRFRLPVLITVGFMVLDVRMQLEINVGIEVRHVHVQDEDEDDEEEEDEEDEVSNASGTSHVSGVENEEEEEEDFKLKEEKILQCEHTE